MKFLNIASVLALASLAPARGASLRDGSTPQDQMKPPASRGTRGQASHVDIDTSVHQRGLGAGQPIIFDSNSGCVNLPSDPTTEGWTRATDGVLYDDLEALGFSYNLLGTIYTDFFKDPNGYVSFGGTTTTEAGYFPNSLIPPFPDWPAMVAPFWADHEEPDIFSVGGPELWYKKTSSAYYITWIDAWRDTSSPANADKVNTYQLVLTDYSPDLRGYGPKNTCFCYEDMEWPSGSNSGFGGLTDASVGINKGDGAEYYLVGSFDSSGSNYKGPQYSGLLSASGVGWLTSKSFCFDAGTGFAVYNTNPDIQVSGFPGSCNGDCSLTPCDCTLPYPGTPTTFSIDMQCPDDTDSYVTLYASFGPFFVEIFETCSTDTGYTKSVDVVLNQPGTYEFTAFTQDGSGGKSLVYTVNVELPNNAPTVGIESTPNQVDVSPVNIPIDFGLSCTDDASSMIVYVNWGDGNTEPFTIPCNVAPTEVSHSYSTAGLYFARISGTDEFGLTSNTDTNTLYIYDPNVGFSLEGKGEFTSPSGALVGSTYSGKASFDFKAQYKNCGGTVTLKGSFEFELKGISGGFTFEADSLEWMVVENLVGSYGAILAGEGTLGGVGNYGFILYAVDSGSGEDTVRIVITNNSDDSVVYDNLFSAQIGYPGTGITKGSVKVDQLSPKSIASACTGKSRKV